MADNDLSSISSFLNVIPLIMIFAGFYYFFIRRPLKKRSKNARNSLEQAQHMLDELKGKIMVVTSSIIPGKEIREVLGYVTGTSSIPAASDLESNTAEREAMVDLMVNALKLGANAVIDVNLSSSCHEQQGSKWMLSKTYYTGTAVKI